MQRLTCVVFTKLVHYYGKRPCQCSPKCVALVGGKTTITCASLQTTPSHVSQYRAENGNLRKSGSTFRHGTMFAPKQCLFQKEAAGIDSPKMHSSSLSKICTYLCGTANYPSHVNQYRTEIGNLWKSESTIRHGTVFAPKECLYQKEPTDMESQ